MTLFQIIDHSTAVFLKPENREAIRSNTEDALDHLKNLAQSLPLFQNLDADFTEIYQMAEKYRHFDDVVFLGTGGSSLGGQAIAALRDTQSPRFHFMDNIDSHTFNKLFETINLEKTAVIAISKSGNTMETLMQLRVCLDIWKKDSIADHFLIVSEPCDNAIRQIAKKYDINCLDHPTDIGGRFAALTVVGAIPAVLSGIDFEAMRRGAKTIVDQIKNASADNCAPLYRAGIHVAYAKQGVNQSVLFPYCDRLKLLANWYCQLWAESLGKKNAAGESCGTTPIQALGTVDQHSQLQLYLDGPRDKLFTFITLNHQESIASISACSKLTHPALVALQGKTMGDLMLAEQRATIDVMRHQNCSVREITIDRLDAECLGALMMNFVFETLAAAYLLQVNPFDQPAVEAGKILAVEYLQKIS
ncbi:MAG: glucose-6-phosphate isomerase [Alphaproteobacteria bacterium]|nr:glucose-6-phosphate isomerase [Alphaproteobacteria bacterium]